MTVTIHRYCIDVTRTDRRRLTGRPQVARADSAPQSVPHGEEQAMASSADPTNPTNERTDRPPMRASDDDRAATVRMLQDAVARGLLTTDEGGERMALAFAFVRLTDLGPLTADLPPAPIAVTAPGW